MQNDWPVAANDVRCDCFFASHITSSILISSRNNIDAKWIGILFFSFLFFFFCFEKFFPIFVFILLLLFSLLFITNRYMYWTDWGWYKGIERADMDGTNRRVITRYGLLSPNGLTLDVSRNWLYWIDTSYGKLEVYEFPSNTRRTIIPAYREPFLTSPLGLTLYESNFFWTDTHLNGIYRADRNTGGNASKVLSTSSRPALIHAYDRNMNITPGIIQPRLSHL